MRKTNGSTPNAVVSRIKFMHIKVVFILQQMENSCDADTTQKCLASAFSRALSENRRIKYIPLPENSVVKRYAEAKKNKKLDKLSEKDAQAILNELELQPQGSGEGPS